MPIAYDHDGDGDRTIVLCDRLRARLAAPDDLARKAAEEQLAAFRLEERVLVEQWDRLQREARFGALQSAASYGHALASSLRDLVGPQERACPHPVLKELSRARGERRRSPGRACPGAAAADRAGAEGPVGSPGGDPGMTARVGPGDDSPLLSHWRALVDRVAPPSACWRLDSSSRTAGSEPDGKPRRFDVQEVFVRADGLRRRRLDLLCAALLRYEGPDGGPDGADGLRGQPGPTPCWSWPDRRRSGHERPWSVPG